MRGIQRASPVLGDSHSVSARCGALVSIDVQIRAAERAGDLERAARLRNRLDGSAPLAGLIATCVAARNGGGNYAMTFRLHAPSRA